jgi:hypothetical protein
LTGLRDLDVTEFTDGIKDDVIVASGMVRDSNLHRQIGDETGLEARPANGVFIYNGQVGDIRAPWMGDWLFVRQHATFAGLPMGRALGVRYQAHGKQGNGLLIERATGGTEPEVVMGYSRDPDRNVGAASFLCEVDGTSLLVHRALEFSAPLQMRWRANSLAALTNVTLVVDRC